MLIALLKIRWLWLLWMVWIFSADQSTSQVIKQITERKAIPLPMYVDELPQTTKIYSYLQPHLNIGMYQKKMKFHRDMPPTTVFAYGRKKSTATFPGPTIEAIRHIPTHITWENHLPDSHILPIDTTILTAMAPHGGVPTVVHLHGGAVEPDSDGSPFAWFTANFCDKGSAWTKRSYVYTNVQHSGNLIYHDHALGLTRVNLLAGLFGPYVIRDPGLEFRLNLPRGEEFDRHLIIADRSFSTDGSIYMNPMGVNPDIHPEWRPEYYGDAITVNGKAWPYLTVKRRKYRFRIINASNARYYNLSLSNGVIPFTVVGSDGSYLSKPVKTSNIVVSIAETFDVVVDFADVEVNSLELLNSAPHPFPNGKVTAGLDSKVMKFVISPSPTTDWSTIPSKLVNYERASRSDTTKTRYIAFYEYMNNKTHHSTHLYINGKRLTDPVTETPRTGSTELWHVINLTDDDHPLHLHVAVFQAIEARKMAGVEKFKECMIAEGDPIKCNIDKILVGERIQTPKHERTWKNVVKMAPWHMTSVIVKFKLVDSNMPYPFDVTKEPGYVYHCHILDHEDNEMIRPLKFIH